MKLTAETLATQRALVAASLVRKPYEPFADVESSLPVGMTLPAYRASRMAPARRTPLRTYWLALLAFVAAWAMVGAVLVSAAHAATTCKRVGAYVTLAQGSDPDVRLTLVRGESVTLPENLAAALTEQQMYPLHSGRSAQFWCEGERVEWRTPNGRILGSWDGRTVHASARVRFQGWES